jgi:hypothetical protein
MKTFFGRGSFDTDATSEVSTMKFLSAVRDEPKPARPWLWIYPSAGVMMVIALGVLFWQAKQSRRDQGAKPVTRPVEIPAERYQLLARFDPPPPSSSAQLRPAMDRYQQGDYAGAILVLQQNSTEAHYYLGICDLLTNDRGSGIQELRTVVASADPALLEKAHFYLAKGLLGNGDINASRNELESVVALHGSLEKQAQSLLAQIT